MDMERGGRDMPNHDRQDRDARFEALVQADRGRLLRKAQRILNDPAEAEDVVQETLGRVWRRLGEIPEAKLRAYLFRSVEFNALKSRARRRTHVPIDALSDPPASEAPEEPEETLGPVELERALDGLSETQKVVLRMKYYLGMTFREIGRTLNISTNTASSRCRYALAALRKVLTSRPHGPERKETGHGK